MTAPRIAIVYDTTEGHSAEIASRIAARLSANGAEPDSVDAEKPPDSLEGYAAVIAGGSVHVGHHGKALVRFAREHRAELEGLPNAFFSVSLSAVKHDEKHLADTKLLVERFEAETGWVPQQVECFAGALVYSKYNFAKRWIMKRIVSSEGGDTDTSRDYDYTDWDAVDHFADEFVARIGR
jgi:menaquinone-dependent protoporphyrinogen oxidase